MFSSLWLPTDGDLANQLALVKNSNSMQPHLISRLLSFSVGFWKMYVTSCRESDPLEVVPLHNE